MFVYLTSRERLAHLFVYSFVAAAFLVAVGQVQAGNFQRSSVGGIVVDADGVVQQPTSADKNAYLLWLRQNTKAVEGEVAVPVELRKVSLRRLEAEIQDAMANNQGVIPDHVKYLAGLQRIKYIFVYPEQNDIVLAGPGEGWKVSEDADVVGITTGAPVLRLDDLLIALRTVHAARTETISVSIDPTTEGLQQFNQVMRKQRYFNPLVLKQLAQAMGPQDITYTGVSPETHFARVLAAADYRMKRIAMNLDPSPLRELPGFLDMLKAKRRVPNTMIPRWWMACNYEPLARTEDKMAWELRGPGVKAMTEEEHVATDGTIQATGRADVTAQQWADLMTKHFEELAKRDLAFAKLRNLMDMCVVAALIEQEDLMGVAGCEVPTLANSQSDLEPQVWHAPHSVGTQCSHLKIGRNYVITASGGVQIDSWQVASRSEVKDEIQQTRASAAAPAATKAWWWN